MKWLNLRVPFWWKRRYKKFCAMKGVYMPDYTKVAIEEKMKQDPEDEKNHGTYRQGKGAGYGNTSQKTFLGAIKGKVGAQ